MIASIAPLKRLPRSSSIFDYLVPTELEGIIQPGQLVVIELRRKKEFGMVLAVSKIQHTEYSYKPIDSIVHSTPTIGRITVQLLSRLSELYAVSIGTLCKTSLLPLQKRKLKSIKLAPELHSTQTNATFFESYFFYENEKQHSALFSDFNSFHTTLILVPEVSKLKEMNERVKTVSTVPIVIWHSDLSVKEKFDLWLRIRNNTEPLVIIGTRSAVTLPFPRLDHIIMDFEHDPQYKNYDQQPRFHTRDVVRMLGMLYGSTCIYASFSPSFELYYAIMKEKMLCIKGGVPYHSGLLFEQKEITQSIRVVEHAPRLQDKRVCSIATEERLISIGKQGTTDAVILVQRKGYATMVICEDCGHIETAEKSGLPMIYREETKMLYAPYDGEVRPLPLSCGSCGSTKLKLHGIGTEKIASYVSALFAKEGITMPIVRIDDNVDATSEETIRTNTPKVLVGTEKTLSYLRSERTGLYVILDLDRYLALPEYNAFEHVVHLIDELNYHRTSDSQLILETSSGEKPIFKLFGERDRVYRTELSLRQKLGYPPYQSMIKYTLSAPYKGTVRVLANRFRLELARRLTEHNISATLSEIYETHPNFEKRMYWYGILLKTNQKNIANIAHMIHPHLPRECIVDIHPLSVLSP